MRRLPLLLVLLAGCSGSASLTIDVDVAVNQLENPFQQIDANPASRGLFFQFDRLDSPCVSLSDLAGDEPVTTPDASGVGLDPMQETFELDPSLLSPNAYYRVTLRAVDQSGATTHIGTGDCPINISQGDAGRTTICFGVNDLASPPVCAGLTPFERCAVSCAGL